MAIGLVPMVETDDFDDVVVHLWTGEFVDVCLPSAQTCFKTSFLKLQRVSGDDIGLSS